MDEILEKRIESSTVSRIAVASVYYSSTQTKKSAFIDHISEAYHVLCSLYGSNLKFIISGDVNRLNIKQILNLSPSLKQVVDVPTRRNPDAILDIIVTNISTHYQPPFTLEPLENDINEPGVPSDHLILMMKPLSNECSVKRKRYKVVKFRPFKESGIRQFGQWVQSQSWSQIYKIKCPNEKAIAFEKMLLDKVNEIFPEKTLKVNENDQPWVDQNLIKLDRKRKREYTKRKKSKKWVELNKLFQERAVQLKESYYTKVVKDLKESNVSK